MVMYFVGFAILLALLAAFGVLLKKRGVRTANGNIFEDMGKHDSLSGLPHIDIDHLGVFSKSMFDD